MNERLHMEDIIDAIENYSECNGPWNDPGDMERA